MDENYGFENTELFDTDNTSEESETEEETSEIGAKEVVITVAVGLILTYVGKKIVDKFRKKEDDDIIDVTEDIDKKGFFEKRLEEMLKKKHKVMISEEEYQEYLKWVESTKQSVDEQQ